jgi:DNA-binding CsgD family transcriptional regulator
MLQQAPSATPTILELTGLIYSAAEDSSRWPEFMTAFAPAIQAERCVLLIADPQERKLSAVRWHGWPDRDIQLYMDRYGTIDPLREGAERAPEGTVQGDYDCCPRQELEASATFREFYAPRGCVHAMGGVILVTPAGHSMITAHRGAKAGPFGEPEFSVLRPLMPHLKRAARLHGELGSLRRQLATFTGHLDRYPYALLLADADRRVLYSNTAARELVAAQDGLAIDNGRIAPASPQSEAALAKAIDELAGGRGASLRRIEIFRPSRRTSYRALLMPIHDSRTMLPLGVAVPAVSVLVIDAESFSPPDPEVLRAIFALTAAEARVCTGLVLGHSVEEVASESRTSVETVRTHVKRIFSKTGTSRQSELVSVILRSVPLRRS